MNSAFNFQPFFRRFAGKPTPPHQTGVLTGYQALARAVTTALVFVLISAASAAAQNIGRRAGEPRGAIGGTVILAEPAGEFADAINRSWGGSAVGHYNLTRFFRIRAEGGYMQYGSEKREVCLPDCRVRFDEVTTNGIGFGSVGPELVLPARFIRPYVHAGIGGSYFSTSSHLDGVDDENDIGETTNFDDGTFLVTAGGGVYLPFMVKGTELAIDLGVRYNRNGTARYLREGDIQTNPDGTISFTPTQSKANLVTFMMGLSVGLGGR